eukprot:7030647-Prymnesium_polylepis.1
MMTGKFTPKETRRTLGGLRMEANEVALRHDKGSAELATDVPEVTDDGVATASPAASAPAEDG